MFNAMFKTKYEVESRESDMSTTGNFQLKIILQVSCWLLSRAVVSVRLIFEM